MSDILAPEALSRIDAFYDHTLKPKLDAIDGWPRKVRWLIIKALFVVLPPIGFLIAGDLLDPFLPFNSSAGTVLVGGLWLASALVCALARYRLPGITAYANYRSRFKQDIVAGIFQDRSHRNPQTDGYSARSASRGFALDALRTGM